MAAPDPIAVTNVDCHADYPQRRPAPNDSELPRRQQEPEKDKAEESCPLPPANVSDPKTGVGIQVDLEV